MREPHVEGVATHDGPEPCTGVREDAGEAWDRGTCGPGIEPRNLLLSGRRRCQLKRKATRTEPRARGAVRPCAVEDPVHVRNLSAREPGDLRDRSLRLRRSGTRREGRGRKPTMNGPEKSDGRVVPTKSPNDISLLMEEVTEGRRPAKGNTEEQNAPRTQRRTSVPSALDRVREAAPDDPWNRFGDRTRGRSRVR